MQSNLKASPSTILRENANVWWIGASANECTDVIMSQITNLINKTLSNSTNASNNQQQAKLCVILPI